MSIQNSTLHFHFPLVAGSDRPVFSDYNTTMELLDEQLYSAVSSITVFGEQIAALQETSGEHTTQLSELGTFQTEQEGINVANADRFLAINQTLSAQTVTNNNKFNSVSIADAYDATQTYSVGDVVTYNGDRYRCITAITTGEPFDADKWQGEDVQTVLDELNSDFRLKSTRTVTLATADGTKTVQQLVAEAVTTLQGLTPLFNSCKIIFFRMPIGGSSLHTFFNGAAIDIFNSFASRSIVGYSIESLTSSNISLYAINSGAQTFNRALFTANGITYENFGTDVPNSNTSITVMIEDYQKG